jgi:hypothetical protein
MDARRLRFVAALLAFALWIAALGVLAISSGRKPRPVPQPAAVFPR